jgi:streptogrisin C
VRHVTCTLLIPAFILATSSAVGQAPSTSGTQAAVDANLQKDDEAAHLQTAEESIEQDAQGYARATGVTIDEARKRILAMKELRAVKSRIQQAYGDRLAGISTEHSPRLQVSVLLTGDAPVTGESITAGGLTVPIVYRTGARSTLKQLRAALHQHGAAIRSLLPNAQGIGISSRTGELVVNVNATGAAATTVLARDAELETLTGVPVRIRALDGKDINLDVRGGSRVEGVNPTDGKRYLCTTGFVVKDTAGTTGVATAAHCENNLTYYNPNGTSIPLTLVPGTESGYGSQDVQIHTSTFVERPEFYVDTAKTQVRYPAGSYDLYATWEGDNACHRGETTGASCSFVEYVFYQPPPENCGGYCADTWVSVTGPNCKGGDSGGPVYDLDLARGLLKGASYSSAGTCNFYYYMPIEFLPSGWSLLLG